MKRLLICLFAVLLTALPIAAQQTIDDELINIKTTLVSIPVVVSDRQGRYVSGLKAEDFTIYKDGEKQEIGFFATAEEPINVALLLDTSRSTEGVIDKIKAAAIEFVSLLEPNDRAMIVTFDSRVNVLSSLTGNRIELERAIRNVEIGWRVGTVMRDAVGLVVERSFAKVNGRKAIILLTDGKDFGSYQDEESLLGHLEESDILLYSVFFQTTFTPQNNRGSGRNRPNNRGGVFGGNERNRRQNQRDRAIEREKEMDRQAKKYLEKMSELTAGRFYKKDVDNLKITFETITDELRKQYRIGFYPKEEQKRSVHELKVKVLRKNLVVRYRSSYRTTE